MNIKQTLLATCLLAASANALAATTADLKVTGKVVPASCDVTIGTGAPLNLGDIQVSALESDPAKPTPMPNATLPYNITCTGPVAISTSWVDNQEADGTYPAAGNNLFRLGKDAADAPIGSLWIQHGGGAIVAVTGNGTETHANVITSADGITWVDSSYGQASKTQMNSFAPAGATTPAAYTTYSGNFTLKPQIAPVDTLDLSTSLNINANATMELNYL